MGFIPVQFCFANRTIEQPNGCDAFHFPPLAGAVLAIQRRRSRTRLPEAIVSTTRTSLMISNFTSRAYPKDASSGGHCPAAAPTRAIENPLRRMDARRRLPQPVLPAKRCLRR